MVASESKVSLEKLHSERKIMRRSTHITNTNNIVEGGSAITVTKLGSSQHQLPMTLSHQKSLPVGLSTVAGSEAKQ